MPQKTVYVEFLAETRKLNEGLKQVDRKVKKSSALMKKMGGIIAGVFAIGKVKQMVTETYRWGLALDQVRREMGITVKEAQQLLFFADATGISMANIRDAAFEIKKRFGEIGENKRFRETMRAIGVDATTAKSLSNAQLMFTTLQKIAQLPLNRQEIALDQAFGGGAAKELNQLVKDAERLDSILAKAGGVRPISGDFGSFTELQTTMALVNANFKSVSAELLIKILPAVTKMLEWVVANEERLLGWATNVQAVFRWLNPIGVLMEGFKDSVGWIADKWEQIAMAVSKVGAAWRDVKGGVLGRLGMSPGPDVGASSTRSSAGTGHRYQIIQNNKINVTDKAVGEATRKAIRKSNAEVFRQAGWTGASGG